MRQDAIGTDNYNGRPKFVYLPEQRVDILTRGDCEYLETLRPPPDYVKRGGSDRTCRSQ